MNDPFAVLDRPEILQFVFYPRRVPLREPGLKGARHLLFPVEEGVRIGCRLYEAAKEAPLIIYFHGNGEIVTDYDDIAPLYTQRGINLLVTDYRGYGFSDGRPTLSQTLKDAHRLFDLIKEYTLKEELSPFPFLMGRSLGSLCAIEVAKGHQEEISGLIVESGSATNFRYLLSRWGLIPYHHPLWEEGRGFFNKEKIAEVTVPTLIIHAERDSLIPLEEAKVLYERSGAKDKRLVIIPDADHNDLILRGRELYFEEIDAFIHRHKRGDPRS